MNPSEEKIEANLRKASNKQTYGIIAGISIMAVLIGFVIITAPVSAVVVDKYDRVKIQYIVWTGSSEDSLDMNKTIWVEVEKRHNNSGEIEGLIRGLFNELVGKSEGYESDVVHLDPCEDKDFDGEDDMTGDDALSYGLPSDEFFGKSIKFQVKILEIEKHD